MVESMTDIDNIVDMHQIKKDTGDFRRGEDLKESDGIVVIIKGLILMVSYYSSESDAMRALLDEEVELKLHWTNMIV